VNVTARRWYSVLLMRDARGRFAGLRQLVQPDRPVMPRRRRRLPVRFDAVQLVLF
jgi:hypothetical protein